MAPYPGWHAIKPSGLAAIVLVVTVVFTVLSITVVSLRIFCRTRPNIFGTEDWLMCLGLIFNLVHNAVVSYGTFTGIGTPDSGIPNSAIRMEGMKMTVLWQIFYMSGSVFIKTSICTTLLRLAVQRRYQYILYGLIGLAVATTLITLISVLAQCRPLAFAWGEGTGTCIRTDLLITLTYVVSGLNIVTDWTVAVLPVFILWRVQMRRTVKVSVVCVLALGGLASVSTIIRMPYSSVYNNPEDYLVGIGNLILWTVLECDLAIIAGSLPMLRSLVRGLRKEASGQDPVATPSTELVTFGQLNAKRGPIFDTLRDVTDNSDAGDAGSRNESTSNMII